MNFASIQCFAAGGKEDALGRGEEGKGREGNEKGGERRGGMGSFVKCQDPPWPMATVVCTVGWAYLHS